MTTVNDIPAVSPPLPWHGAAWARFNEQLAQKRLPHAILLAGAGYTGVERLALALARLLLCEHPSGGLNCGTCHACNLSASGGHGDFMWLAPEGDSRVIKIDQVRDAIGLAYKTASFGVHTVIVVDPADAMNAASANALLKSLEEPSSGTHLILACRQLHALPATIRSRCQLVKLATPSGEQSLEWLEAITGDRSASEKLLVAADGLPLLAADLFYASETDTQLSAHAASRGLVAGSLAPETADQVFAAGPAPQVLDSVIGALQNRLRSYDRSVLAGDAGRRCFELIDELGQLRLAVEGGANPNMALLSERIVGKVQQILGLAGEGDNIRPGRGRH